MTVPTFRESIKCIAWFGDYKVTWAWAYNRDGSGHLMLWAELGEEIWTMCDIEFTEDNDLSIGDIILKYFAANGIPITDYYSS